MTVCNMAIEMGARVGMIAPDQTTFDWLRGRTQMLKDAEFDQAVERVEEARVGQRRRFRQEKFFSAPLISNRALHGELILLKALTLRASYRLPTIRQH